MRTPIPCLPWLLLLAMGCQSAPARPPAAANEAHVSPAGSNRFNDGSRRRPFESLKAALAAERHFHIRHPGQTFRIHLHGGTYFLDAPISLGPEDSHTVFAAWPGEKPLLLGGEKVALGGHRLVLPALRYPHQEKVRQVQ